MPYAFFFNLADLSCFLHDLKDPWVHQRAFVECQVSGNPMRRMVSLISSWVSPAYRTQPVPPQLERACGWMNASFLTSWKRFGRNLSIIVKSQTHWVSNRWGELFHILLRGNEQDWGEDCVAWCKSSVWILMPNICHTFVRTHQLRPTARNLNSHASECKPELSPSAAVGMWTGSEGPWKSECRSTSCGNLFRADTWAGDDPEPKLWLQFFVCRLMSPAVILLNFNKEENDLSPKRIWLCS